MKKFIFILIAFCISIFAFAEEKNYIIKGNSVVVEKVIPFEQSITNASEIVRNYFIRDLLVDSNTTLKLSDDNTIIAKANTPTLLVYSMGFWETKGDLTIEVKFKESRMKVIIMCNTINCSSSTNKYSYNITDAYPINKNHNTWNLQISKKDAEKTFDRLISSMYEIILRIENQISMNNIEENENW